MSFSVLKRAIQALNEKTFYDIAILYLSKLGYQDLSIIDGSGDGGQDVVTSRKDLRIQLSIRRDWQIKINSEAEKTKESGRSNFIYITNRDIRSTDAAEFFATKYKFAGEIEVSVHDLNRIATTLSLPGASEATYRLLGLTPSDEIIATNVDIAISSIILFSPESKSFREELVEANISAYLYKNPNSSVEKVTNDISKVLPGIGVSKDISSSLSRMRQSGRLSGSTKSLSLSADHLNVVSSAERSFKSSLSSDIDRIVKEFGFSELDAFKIIELALELTARNGSFGGGGPIEESIKEIISRYRIKNKEYLYGIIAETNYGKVRQYAQSISHIFSANTFDIYRSLGKKTNLVLILDSSVAMPFMFALLFGQVSSRYSVTTLILKQICESHEIDIVVPTCYINEMASHGEKAIEYLEIYQFLPSQYKDVLRGSKNAYLSYYSYYNVEKEKLKDKSISLPEFLSFFGLRAGSTKLSVENRITSILSNIGIKTIDTGGYDRSIRDLIAEEKPDDFGVLIDHDASVCSYVRRNIDKGYILCTWDNVIIDIMQDIVRVLSDNPARIVDFMSIANSADADTAKNYEILTTLIHCDEQKLAPLAKRIEDVRNADEFFRLQQLIDKARVRVSGGVTEEDMEELIAGVNL